VADASCGSAPESQIGLDEIRAVVYDPNILAARNVGVVPSGPDRKDSTLDDQVRANKKLRIYEARVPGRTTGFVHSKETGAGQQDEI
jgi:hypothetical protein